MKPKTKLEFTQQWEVLVDQLAQCDVEPEDAYRLINGIEEMGTTITPALINDAHRAVAEAIRRRNAPKSHLSPGSGKTHL